MRLLFYTVLFAGVLAADPTTFAQFHQTDNTQPFVWTNSGPISTLNYNGSSTVQFCFLVPTAAGACDIEAYLEFNAATDDPAILASSAVLQPIDAFSFSFIRVSDGADLLSGTGSGGIITGMTSSNGATLQYSSTGGTLNYTSAFLGFTPPNDAAFGFTALVPGLGLAQNGQLYNFVADGAGTFSSGVVTPEPGTLAMALLGFGITLIGRRMRKADRS
jgi:hypothetical protein